MFLAHNKTDGLDDISASFQLKKLCDSVIGIILSGSQLIKLPISVILASG